MSFFKKFFGEKKPPIAHVSKYNFGKNVLQNDDPDFDILNDLIYYLLARFEDTGWEENEVFESLPTWYRNAYLAWCLNAEVLNGGVLQYFYNSSGEHPGDMSEAFKIMGEDRLHKFMQMAIDAHKGLEKLEKSKPSVEETNNYIKKNHYILDSEYYRELEELLYDIVDNYIKQEMKLSGETNFIIP